MNLVRIRVVVAFAFSRTTLLLLSLLLGSGIFASAQSVLGTISGTIHDSSGAVIPAAKVILHRVETNTDRSVDADARGARRAYRR